MNMKWNIVIGLGVGIATGFIFQWLGIPPIWVFLLLSPLMVYALYCGFQARKYNRLAEEAKTVYLGSLPPNRKIVGMEMVVTTVDDDNITITVGDEGDEVRYVDATPITLMPGEEATFIVEQKDEE